ncbi:hypothetical protein EYF80_012967 [Liparis tanakae]|uniref:Uncharacterized protein n=1 Tax=Liparis tanakae TaxID=230148 RepID=A0A4Z2IFH7_9TELE|nr:hypothetical protein EYF80_012967 [Liparis tanakae]
MEVERRSGRGISRAMASEPARSNGPYETVNVGQTEVECFHMTSPTNNNSPAPPPGPGGDGGNARVDT